MLLERSVALKACRAHRTVFLHSVLILFRLLPLDIRVREASWLKEAKHGKDMRDTFVDRKHDKPVCFVELHHPAHVPEIGIVVLHIYTNGSRIEGKVGMALTE